MAWRINRLIRLGRACPDLPVDLLFKTEEWQAAYLLHNKAVPTSPPPLQEVVRLVALLNGILGRKGDGEPGARTSRDDLEQNRFTFTPPNLNSTIEQLCNKSG